MHLREVKEKLDVYFNEVSSIILSRQNPATGLIPASVAITTHGDYRDAWVRDNVYSIMAVWALSLAYRRIDDDDGRAYELEHATIKCMRGLLFSMMRQAHKVEQFKNTQHIEHALHAKYNTATGDTVVGDREWGHLQIDATSIFLLQLAQMTASGLRIIYTLDEVNFIQNLNPDYGIWERGNKINHGQPELNSSSIGMAVAALQAINGINLFGARGGPSSVIHVLPDEMTRNYTTLHSALPRESNSKEVDAAVLSVISYPAFAVSDKKLMDKTRNDIVKKLGGRFGFKRFLRDGHQTVLEDTTRLHYDPHELKIFEGIECEWPLFFTYMILDGFFREDHQQVEEYFQLLEPLLVDSTSIARFGHSEHTANLDPRSSTTTRRQSTANRNNRPQIGTKLVPELYIVPRDLVDKEKGNPGSVDRFPNENLPLVWAQSLYIMSSLLKDNLLSVGEVDPLGRRLTVKAPKQGRDVVVQIVFLAESVELQAKLATLGLETQTVETCAPVTISPPSALRDAYTALGQNAKLKLSGRPKRPMGTLSTCKLYRCQGRLYAFSPHFMDKEEFYLISDNNYFVSVFEQELAFVQNHWWSSGRPTMVIMITSEMLGSRSSKAAGTMDSHRWRHSSASNSRRNLLNFMMSLRTGVCNGVRVRIGRLGDMINTSCIESLDFLVSREQDDPESWHSTLQGDGSGRAENTRRLHFSNEGDGASNAKPRTVRRKSSGDLARPQSATTAAPKTPLKASVATSSKKEALPESYKLKDHVECTDGQGLHISNQALSLGGEAREAYMGSPRTRSKSPMRNLSANRLGRASFSNGSRSHDALVRTELEEALGLSDGSAARGSAELGIAQGSALSQSGLLHVETASDSPLTISSDSPTSPCGYQNVGDMLTLTLGDHSNVDSAIRLLKSSSNLFDQIDLLHYLHSCLGPNHAIEGLAEISALLEEVYAKARELKIWSVVRQAAGLLRKVVNSLTINITDLLIRGKPVTVGFGEKEVLMAEPKSPEDLAHTLFSHCTSDVREAPIVQEVITYLGSFVRSNPALFDGIQRIRTHFFVIAMREEISRMKGCDEEEAIEFLMELSPSELKSLLNTILSNPDQATSGEAIGMGMSVLSKWRTIGKGNATSATVPTPNTASASGSSSLPSMLNLTVQSAGFNSGNYAKFELTRDGAPLALSLDTFGRGLNVVVVDPLDGSVVETASFDTHTSGDESAELVRFVEWLEPGMIIAIAMKDDGAEHLTEAARETLESLGATRIRDVSYRDSWCLISEKGADRSTTVEAFSPSKTSTPTEPISRSIDLSQRRKTMLAAFPNQSQARLITAGAATNLLMPTGGKWLRRRRNDGALNRVPQGFYPKVWHVLNKTVGITVGDQFLPRDPTVSEKTPEELNFAIQIENVLDSIRDPAERQIAIESLVVISRISERNPEIHIRGDQPLDLLRILREATSRFWARYLHDQNPDPSVLAEAALEFRSIDTLPPLTFASGGVVPSGLKSRNISPSTSSTNLSGGAAITDVTFEKNVGLAKRLFLDLPPEGKDGTMTYLAESCVRLCFDVKWAGSDGLGYETHESYNSVTITA
ncbi:glycosyl hydrolases family 15-domain-containing protein [Chytridium lagenaria]|nr:glycosyl hydrolases family 15-domain-containing protein [Chytridium lagenaria]